MTLPRAVQILNPDLKFDPPYGSANLEPRSQIWTIFKEVHQTMFHVKYLSSSLYGLGGEDFLSFFFRLPWQPQFCMEFKSFNNFERTLCQKHLHQVLSNLAKWFMRRSHFNEKFYRWTVALLNWTERPFLLCYFLLFEQILLSSVYC